ncbi:MAG: DUF3429 domain-containing protein [Pseudomonadota bacterium]
MRTPVPAVALLLGAAGLLPFLWGVATMVVPSVEALTLRVIGPRFVGPFVVLQYGTIILCFMSGVLWGFATRAEGTAAGFAYGLSVVPALWAFFFVGNGPTSAAINLLAGFLAVLAIDAVLWSNGLTPKWWLALRIPLTAVVSACLAFIIVVS